MWLRPIDVAVPLCSAADSTRIDNIWLIKRKQLCTTPEHNNESEPCKEVGS
jgi:hypothetical protein